MISFINKYSILLQLLVIAAACTAILGRLIELPAIPIVFWRTLLAAIIMLIWLTLTKRAPIQIKAHEIWSALGIGAIMALHWITFFGSIQLSNISVCLAGLASLSLFTAFTEPIIERKKPKLTEMLLGLMVIPGLLLIAGAAWHHIIGLLCALVSAFLASLFPVLNRRLTLRGLAPETLTLYEMAGAAAVCFIASSIYSPQTTVQLPSPNDWLWLGILATFCTVWASSTQIYLLRRFSAFTTNLVLNLEPIYGILLAAVIFSEHQDLNFVFYLGATCIVSANLIHAYISRKAK